MENKLSDAHISELQKLIAPYIQAAERLNSNLALIKQSVATIMDAYMKGAGVVGVVRSANHTGEITQMATPDVELPV